jgi:hypothetical protein
MMRVLSTILTALLFPIVAVGQQAPPPGPSRSPNLNNLPDKAAAQVNIGAASGTDDTLSETHTGGDSSGISRKSPVADSTSRTFSSPDAGRNIVRSHDALLDGSNSDKINLQNLRTATPNGGVIDLPPGNWPATGSSAWVPTKPDTTSSVLWRATGTLDLGQGATPQSNPLMLVGADCDLTETSLGGRLNLLRNCVTSTVVTPNLNVQLFNSAPLPLQSYGLFPQVKAAQFNAFQKLGGSASLDGLVASVDTWGQNNFTSQDVALQSDVTIHPFATDSTWGLDVYSRDLTGSPATPFGQMMVELDTEANGPELLAGQYDPSAGYRNHIWISPGLHSVSGWTKTASRNYGDLVLGSQGGVATVYRSQTPRAARTGSVEPSWPAQIQIHATADTASGDTIQVNSTSGISVGYGVMPDQNAGGTAPYTTVLSVVDRTHLRLSAPVTGHGVLNNENLNINPTVVDGGVTWMYGEPYAVQYGKAIWLNDGDSGHGERNSISYLTGFGTNGRFENAVIDLSKASFVHSYSAAIRLGAGHILDFDGDGTAAKQNQHQMVYSGGTWVYKSGGLTALQLDDTAFKFIANGKVQLASGGQAQSVGVTTGYAPLALSVATKINNMNDTDLIAGQGGLNIYHTNSSGTIASSSRPDIQTDGSGNIGLNTSVHYGGSVPSLSCNGTGAAQGGHNTNSSGAVNPGSGSSSCTVTWAVAYTSYSNCMATSRSPNSTFGYTFNLARLTVTGTALTLFDYRCDGL